jgi:hypothetical protein
MNLSGGFGCKVGYPVRWVYRSLVPLLVLTIIACGGGSGGSGGGSSPSQPAVSVSVSSPAAQVMLGQTAQFTASVQNAANSTVTWEVNAVQGGNSTVGTITGSGLYTAPNAIPSPNSIQVTAVSDQDPSKSASATISLTSNIVVSVSPTTVTITAGLTQQFSVSLQNAINVGVTWEVNGVAGGSSANGTITNTGLYTAPATVPGSAVTVTAVSVADPSKSGSATVTITPGITVSVSPNPSIVFVGNTLQLTATVTNASNTAVTWSTNGGSGSISSAGLYTPDPSLTAVTDVIVTATSVEDPTKSATAIILANIHSANDSALTGHYTFSGARECDSCASEHYALSAGSLAADGAGTVTSAVVDFINFDSPLAGGPLSAIGQQAIGAYSVDSNNQGELILVAPGGGNNSFGGFVFTLGSFSQGVAERGQIFLLGNGGSGILLAQDTTAFSTAAINGNYAFGSTVQTLLEPLAGEFQADGAGNLSNGIIDINDPADVPPLGLSNAPFTGTYTVDPNTGRGTATMNVSTIGTMSATFYVISAKELFWFGDAFIGSALQQQGAPFSNQSLNGTGVFALGELPQGYNGSISGGPGSAGLLTADGNGNVSGVVDGIIDNTGALVQDQAFNGTYTVSSNGRGVLNVFNQTFVIYLVGQNSAFVLEEPNNVSVQTGLIEPQASGPFGNASISGTFIGGASSGPLDETIGLNQINLLNLDSNGNGTISGQIYIVSSPYAATYSVASNGRGTLSDSTDPSNVVGYVLYMISTNRFVAVETAPPAHAESAGTGALSFFGP